MKKVLFIAAILSASSAFAGEIVEYRTGDELRLYDAECYAKAPGHTVAAPGGGYSYLEAASKDECGIHGVYARAELHKRDKFTGATIIFRGPWVTESRARLQAAKYQRDYVEGFGSPYPYHQQVVVDVRKF